MKTHIDYSLMKTLLVSMSILTLGLTSSPALADNDNYDGRDVISYDFKNRSLKNSSWVGATLVEVDFSFANLANANFTGAQFETDINFFEVDCAGADFRKAQMGGIDNFNIFSHDNIIGTDGAIYNLNLSSADAVLTIRGVEDANAFLDKTYSIISNGATLTLTQNAVLELTGGTQLILGDGGKLNFDIDAANASSLTGIVIEAGSRLTLESNSIIDITIENFSLDGPKLTILSWQNDDDVAELLTRLEDTTAYRINGKTLAEMGIAAVIDHDNNTFSIIPEPSTATLSLLALAGLLARRRRKAA